MNHCGARLVASSWDGDGDVVLFAHATGFHKEMWVAVVSEVQRLGVTATLVAIDLPGHGGSPQTVDGPNVWDYGAAVAAFVDEATRDRTGRAFAVGHSLGGMAVTACEITGPGTFDGLVLIDPALFPSGSEGDRPTDSPWAAAAQRRRALFPDRDAAFESYRGKAVFSGWSDEVLSLYVDHGFEARDGAWALRCDPTWEAATFSQDGFPEVWDRAVSVGVPITLLTAEFSTTHDTVHAEASARQLSAQHVRVPGVSHLIPMEAPALVAATVAAVLSA